MVDARGVEYFRGNDGCWHRPGLQPADGLGWDWRNLEAAHGPLRSIMSPLEVVEPAIPQPATQSLKSIENLHREIREKDKAWRAAKIEVEMLKRELQDLKDWVHKEASRFHRSSGNDHLDEAEGVLESVVDELAEGKELISNPALWLQVVQANALIAIAEFLKARL